MMVASSSLSARNVSEDLYRRSSCCQLSAPRGVAVGVGLGSAVAVGAGSVDVDVGEIVDVGGNRVTVIDICVSFTTRVSGALVELPWQATKPRINTNKIFLKTVTIKVNL